MHNTIRVIVISLLVSLLGGCYVVTDHGHHHGHDNGKHRGDRHRDHD